MTLKGGGEILLVVWVVYATLGLVFLNAVNRVVGSEWEDGRGWDLVQVLRFHSPIFKAVQVL